MGVGGFFIFFIDLFNVYIQPFSYDRPSRLTIISVHGVPSSWEWRLGGILLLGSLKGKKRDQSRGDRAELYAPQQAVTVVGRKSV